MANKALQKYFLARFSCHAAKGGTATKNVFKRPFYKPIPH